MDQQSTILAEVASHTAAAAHRRDHRHDQVEDACHPHVVEVVHLGDRALTICHDCCADSGFLPHRRAERLATEHRRRTVSSSQHLSAIDAA